MEHLNDINILRNVIEFYELLIRFGPFRPIMKGINIKDKQMFTDEEDPILNPDKYDSELVLDYNIIQGNEDLEEMIGNDDICELKKYRWN